MDKLYNYFEKIYNNEKISHAFLIGNTKFSEIKESLEKIICNFIINCNIEIENNPDIIILNNEESSINKEEIKQLLKNLSTTSQFLNKKIYIINNCENLSETVYNAILKTLEEPSENIHAFLLTNNISKVKETISSRCQKIFISSSTVKNQIEDKYFDIANRFLTIYDKEKIKMIANNNDIYSIIDSRENLINILECMSNILLNNILSNFKDSKNYLNYDIKIINKILIINETKENLKNNLNKNLCIDRLIIEMWCIDNEINWS